MSSETIGQFDIKLMSKLSQAKVITIYICSVRISDRCPVNQPVIRLCNRADKVCTRISLSLTLAVMLSL